MTIKFQPNIDGSATILVGATPAIEISSAGKISFPAGREYKSGEIIQQLVFTDAGASLPAILGNVTVSAKSITPKSTDSTIKVSCSFYGYPQSSGTYFNVQLRRTTQTAGFINELRSLGLTTNAAQAVFAGIAEGSQQNSALNQISFQLWANSAAGAGGIITSMEWTITEIQN
jgi:hypothetical protein